MSNPFSIRPVALWVTAAALLLALSGTALAAEGEDPTESGWVEQEAGAPGSEGGPSEVRRGSSLGSGAGVAPTPEPQIVDPAPTPEPGTVPDASAPPEVGAERVPIKTADAESERTTTTDELAPAPLVATTERRAPLAGGTAAVGAPVAPSPPPSSTESGLEALVATSTKDVSAARGSSLSGSALIPMGVVALLFAGLFGYFGVRRLSRRHRWQREAAEWQSAVRRLDDEVRPQLKVRRVAGDEAAGSRAARTGVPPAKVH